MDETADVQYYIYILYIHIYSYINLYFSFLSGLYHSSPNQHPKADNITESDAKSIMCGLCFFSTH